MLVVMVDHCLIRGKPPIVIEATLLSREESAERCRAISLIGRAIRLELIDSDFLCGMHRPSGLCEERWHVTGRALANAIENGFATCCGGLVETSGGGFWCRNRQLIV